MKKSIITIALIGAFSSVSYAQTAPTPPSNFTYTFSGYGDIGIKAITNAAGESIWKLSSQQSAYDSVFLTATEDLGDGLKVSAYGNIRYDMTDGSEGPAVSNGVLLFRQAWINTSGSFGEFRVGRIYMPLEEIDANYDAFNTGTVGTVHTAGINANVRANSAVNYRSPNRDGFIFTVGVASKEALQTSFDNGSSPLKFFMGNQTLAQHNPVGINARYIKDNASFSVAYDSNSAAMKTTGLYGSYNFGWVKPMFQYEHGDSCISATVTCVDAATGAETMDAFSISLTAPIGKYLLRTGVLGLKSNLANRDGNKFGIGGDYSLSTKTNLYANIGQFSGSRFTEAEKKPMFDFGITTRF